MTCPSDAQTGNLAVRGFCCTLDMTLISDKLLCKQSELYQSRSLTPSLPALCAESSKDVMVDLKQAQSPSGQQPVSLDSQGQGQSQAQEFFPYKPSASPFIARLKAPADSPSLPPVTNPWMEKLLQELSLDDEDDAALARVGLTLLGQSHARLYVIEHLYQHPDAQAQQNLFKCHRAWTLNPISS